MMLVDCSRCRTPLQLPPGARTIRCAICSAVTRVADPLAAPPPPPPHHHYSAPPPPFSPGPSSGQPHSRKRAVIVGISYRNSRHELKGCLNDAKCMRFLLVNRFKFPPDSILMLTEEETDPYRIPTKHNIRMAMHWLVVGCQPGDSLVFHYSGHGSQQRNYNGDEVDGYDETLCPLDFETQGMIVDDEINATLVRPIPRGAKLHAIIDACHSGTMLDLPFLCRMDRSGRYMWEDHRPRSGAWKGSSGGEVISFSGCDDDQTSADTDSLSQVTSTGAMTYSFIQAIEHGQGTTYGSILNAMRASIRSSDNGLGGSAGSLVTSLLTMLVTGGSGGIGMRQEPQLTANEQFDVRLLRPVSDPLFYSPMKVAGRFAFLSAVTSNFLFLTVLLFTSPTVSIRLSDRTLESPADPFNRPSKTAVFSLGSFWRSEAVFGCLDGVVRTTAGYAGGSRSNPEYRNLGDHAECVQIEYDPRLISFRQLLEVFWSSHDSRQVFGQGPDVGNQYRSIIFTNGTEEARLAGVSKEREQSRSRSSIVTTQIQQLETFYPAEPEHQKFELKRNPFLLQLMGNMPEEELESSTMATKLNGYAAELCPPKIQKQIDAKINDIIKKGWPVLKDI
nr:metacaspase-1-like [Ipomoea batatas]